MTALSPTSPAPVRRPALAVFFVLLMVAAMLALAGCSSASPAPKSAQPEVDAAVVATLPDDFAKAFTEYDEGDAECVTTVTTLPYRYGLSASMTEDAVDLLREGGERLGCVAVLHVVNDDGDQVDIGHLAKYLPVEARDGDIVIRSS
ncbi:hypothetical protein [Agreia pratensis]|uniref:Uncharacterized protein n=1 Tax=Agreia pratensis TaxID=150121 RepID=A0A1X7KYS8_9MICO|nr:hypothetical protein [Agreia pratensis]SMG46778.1 hypothetical protein SAMN06296010_3125 [Agreia pratensis]